jgi:hypothetical protein
MQHTKPVNDNRLVNAIDFQNDGASNTNDTDLPSSPDDVNAARGVLLDDITLAACRAALASALSFSSTANNSAKSRSTDDNLLLALLDDDDDDDGVVEDDSVR